MVKFHEFEGGEYVGAYDYEQLEKALADCKHTEDEALELRAELDAAKAESKKWMDWYNAARQSANDYARNYYQAKAELDEANRRLSEISNKLYEAENGEPA